MKYKCCKYLFFISIFIQMFSGFFSYAENNPKDNAIQQNLNHFLNLAIDNRPDLKSDIDALKTVEFDKLNDSLKKKWNQIVIEIRKNYNELKSAIAARNNLEVELLQAYSEKNAFTKQNSNDKKNIIELKQNQTKLNNVRRLFVLAEKNVFYNRQKLYSSCGVSVPMPKKTCITTLNQAQQSYVRARKAYIKAEIGILNSRAGLKAATGTPIN